ncbi:calcium/sodium antiporter [Rheinheimera sp. F8]|uniref:calcium/sodium antiporter n=1 Tax=Rheinheimera sp. F8 TaxID=1763998 RepID=UPI000AEF95D7|nr:calcium/sodium antiporter [Rheinheimera sp. F8]
MMTWLLLGLGLVLLVAGADTLVKGAARLAGAFGIPSLVIGLTVVAFGTSAPELAVSVKAAYAGQAELAIANVVGSNIFNVLFILGVSAVIVPLVISKQLIRQDVPIMVAASFLCVWMVQDGQLSRFEAAVLFAGLISYTVFLFRQGKQQGADGGDDEVEALLKEPHPMWQNVLFVVGGLALLVLGARLLVDSAVALATAWGVNEAVIGLTIVAAGTSLPEVVTSIVATIRGERDIAVGNVVGSNIFNILCVLGLSGLVSPVPLLAGAQMAALDIPVMLAVALLCVPFFFAGAILNRIEGALFLAAYVAYTWYLVALTLKLDYLPQLQDYIVYGLIPVIGVYVVLSLLNDFRQRRKQVAS